MAVNIVTDFGADPTGVADSTTPIQNALNAGPGQVFCPAGTYLITSSLTMNTAGQSLFGEARGSVVFNSVASVPTVSFGGSPIAVEIRNIWFDHSTTCVGGENAIDTTGAVFPNLVRFKNLMITNHYIGMNLGNTGYSFIEGCYAANNYSHGMQLLAPSTGGSLQWTITDSLFELNDGYGLVATAANNGTHSCSLGEWNNVSTYGNRDGGIAVLGNVHTRFQAVRMMGGFLGGDGSCSLLLDSYSLYPNKVVGLYTELTGTGACGRHMTTTTPPAGYGIMLTGNNETTELIGCTGFGHSASGVYTAGSNTIISGGDFSNNGASNIVGNRNGIYIGAGRAQVVGCRATANQYGIAWANDNHIITSNSLSGNTTAAYLNAVPIVKTILGANLLT